jgi:hypothetical protein
MNEWYKFVGLAIVLYVILCLILKSYSYQKKVVENMTSTSTSKDSISGVVSSNSDVIGDALLISKYRSDYEDTIINLEKAVGLGLLSEVINNAETISKDPVSTDSITAINNINSLRTFRESLNTSMIILDKN